MTRKGCVNLLDDKELTPEEKKAVQEKSERNKQARVEWKPIYTRILAYDQQNIEDSEIRRRLKVSQSTITRLRASEIYQTKRIALTKRIEIRTTEKLAESESNKVIDQAREHLARSCVRAARKVTGILRKGQPTDRIRLDAAKDILDRVGIKAAQVIETHERVYAPEEVTSARQTLIEMETHLERQSKEGTPYLLKTPKKALEQSKEPGSSKTDKGSMTENTESTSPTLPASQIPDTGECPPKT